MAEQVDRPPAEVTPGGQTGRRLGGLEGLRGFACLAVIGAHATVHFAPRATPGPLPEMLGQGLTVFFAMSGMLIALPFVRDIAAGTRRVRLGRYALRRLRRIFPAYLLIFLVSNFVLRAVYLENAVAVHAPRSDVGTGMLTGATPLFLNLSLLQTFSPTWLESGINPSWSLTTELAFYAVLPVLAVPLVGRFKHRLVAALLPAVVLWVAGLAGRVWAEQLYAGMPGVSSLEAEFGPHPVAVLSRSLLGLGDMFAAGMVVAVLFVWTERGELPWWNRRRAMIVAGGSIVVGTVCAALVHEIHPWFLGAFTAVVAGGIILLIADPEARREPSMIVRLAGWRPFEYLGKISLSVYLWHYPILILLTRADLFTVDSLPVAIGSTVTLAVLAIALGSLTYTWVERPALTGTWPGRFRRSRPKDADARRW